MFAAAVGLYLLCMEGDRFSLSKGDGLVFCCAVLFSFHILVIDYYAPKTDGVKLSCIQFLVCGILSFLMMLIFERPGIIRYFGGEIADSICRDYELRRGLYPAGSRPKRG